MKREIKNIHLSSQIRSQISQVSNFTSVCKLAAQKDDGKIDKDEEAILKKLDKCSQKYIEQLRKLL